MVAKRGDANLRLRKKEHGTSVLVTTETSETSLSPNSDDRGRADTSPTKFIPDSRLLLAMCDSRITKFNMWVYVIRTKTLVAESKQLTVAIRGFDSGRGAL